ncbi:MAG TPA: hypothetical protein VIC54_07905 [Terriglobales bacterium]
MGWQVRRAGAPAAQQRRPRTSALLIRLIEPEQLVAAPAPLPLPQASFQRSGGQIKLLLPVIAAWAAQGRAADAQIQTLREELTAAEPDTPNECQHRDLNIIRSLPGVGTRVAATMLAEAHQALARRDHHALRAHASVARSRAIAARPPPAALT